MIAHVTKSVISYISTHTKHLPLSRSLVVNQLTYLYNFKSSHISLTSLFKRQKKSIFALHSAFYSLLCLLLIVKGQPNTLLLVPLQAMYIRVLSLLLLHHKMICFVNSCKYIQKTNRISLYQRPDNLDKTFCIGLSKQGT